jgi:hypothetical protein
MVNLFVKVDGKLQRYGVTYPDDEAVDRLEELRALVQQEVPKSAKSVSPVLALFEKTK